MRLIKNGVVFEHKKGFDKKDILIENGRISKIQKEINLRGCEVLDACGCYVVPGFIDIHTHGAKGLDVMTPNFETLESLSLFYASKGVTSFLPTVLTASLEEINDALENIKNAIEKGTKGSKIIGINMEGPFINYRNKGAQPGEHIITPTVELIEGFIKRSGNNIRLMTIAPEVSGAMEVVEYFKGKGITFAAGHSSLDYSSAINAFNAGFNHITHLFNAMTGIHHREPGLAGAALDSENVTVEIIADGIHVDPAVVRMAIKCKTPHKVVLITDSTVGAGIEEGVLSFGGQKIIVKNGSAVLENGVLAGSTLTMADGVKNMVEKFNVSLEDAVIMASENPARVINVESRKGSLSYGKDADIVILDSDIRVLATIVEGNIAHKKSTYKIQ